MISVFFFVHIASRVLFFKLKSVIHEERLRWIRGRGGAVQVQCRLTKCRLTRRREYLSLSAAEVLTVADR
jgi:hypothetical protein